MHLLQIAQTYLHEAGQISIQYRCSTVSSRLLIRRTINSSGWIFTLLQTNSSEIVSVCDNKYTQHIKTDYESTKSKTTTTNNNFNCIHVRNKYILNQNRIQFTVWIYKIQLPVNFCKTISERSQTLSSRKSKWLKLKPLDHIPNVVINPPKRTKLVKLGLKSLLRFKITKCRWIYDCDNLYCKQFDSGYNLTSFK